MPNKVNVGSEIVFQEEANHQDNMKGNPSTERMCSVDWFDQTTLDTTYDYTSTIADDGTHALSAGGANGVTLTTGATDNDVDFLATGLIFDITQEPEIESKIEITDVTGTFVFFGFSDATSETSPAASIDADGGTLTNAATNAAGFVIDADLGSSSIYCASVNAQGAGGTVQNVDSATDWADGATHVLRVKLDSSGNAYFWLDGVQVGYIALAVADVPLCAIWNDGTRDNDGANTVYARYLKKWKNCS